MSAAYSLALTAYLCISVRARVGLSVVTLTEQNFEGFLATHEKVLIEFYNVSDQSSDSLSRELLAAMRKVRGYGSQVQLAKVDTTSVDLVKRFVSKHQLPVLMWFTHGEATKYQRTLRTADHIADFILALDREAIVRLESDEDLKNYNRVMFAQLPRTSPEFRVLEVVAAKHLDTVAFLYKERAEKSVTFLMDGFPPRSFSGDLTVYSLDHFVNTMLMKSEEPPLEQEDGPIVVVGTTFEELVLRQDKDVFLNIYAPYCGHCRKFAAVWTEFALQAASSLPNLVVAKMDGTQNGSPMPDEFSWDAYPSVFFVKAGSTIPFVYHDERSVSHLMSFAREHSSGLLRPLSSVQEDDVADEDL